MCNVKIEDLTVAYRTQPVSYSWFSSSSGPHAIYSRCSDGVDKLIDVVTKYLVHTDTHNAIPRSHISIGKYFKLLVENYRAEHPKAFDDYEVITAGQ